MDILFIADNFPPEKNAQASRVYERACYWVRWGHDVTVITCFPNFPEGRIYPGYRNALRKTEVVSGIRTVRVKSFIAANAGTVLRIIDFISFMVSAIVAGLFERRPDVVAATSPQFFAAIAGWALAAIHRVPFVLEISDLWPDSIVAVGAMKRSLALRWLEKIELFLYRRATRIVALTESFRQNMITRGIPAEKIDVVINGVDLTRYAPREKDVAFQSECGLQDNHFVVAYIGTHGMAHALENVLDAAARTSDDEIRYLFVGAGAEKQRLVADAAHRGLKNVIFAPAQPKERMPSVWSVCDVALVHLKDTPLFRSVIPSKIFEAMAMGRPVLLACPEGEATRIVGRERAGICVPPADPDGLARAAGLFKDNHPYLRQFAQNSHAAAPRYSRERQAADMLSTLERACGKTSDPAAAVA